jgi:HEAT repeat protein
LAFLMLVVLVGAPPPLEDARDALVDGSLRERMRAPLALARASDRGAIPLMIERLRADPDPLVRYRIAAAFREMPAPEAAEALRATVRDDTWYAAMHAIAALRRLARP